MIQNHFFFIVPCKKTIDTSQVLPEIIISNTWGSFIDNQVINYHVLLRPRWSVWNYVVGIVCVRLWGVIDGKRLQEGIRLWTSLSNNSLDNIDCLKTDLRHKKKMNKNILHSYVNKFINSCSEKPKTQSQSLIRYTAEENITMEVESRDYGC